MRDKPRRLCVNSEIIGIRVEIDVLADRDGVIENTGN